MTQPRQAGPLPSGRFPAVHYVLAGRTAVRDAHSAFTFLIRYATHTGGHVPARVGTYLEELTRALGVVPAEGGSAAGTEEVPQPNDDALWPADDETVDVAEAAALLGLTTRRTRQLAPVLGGRLVNRAYRLPRLEVLAERDRRREERDGDPDHPRAAGPPVREHPR